MTTQQPRVCTKCERLQARITTSGVCEYCRRREKTGACVQCGQVKWIRARGLCTTCYDAKKKRGVCTKCGKEKARVTTSGVCEYCSRRDKSGPCVQCGQVKWIRAHGLCTSCYDAEFPPKSCGNCGASTNHLAKNLCGACYMYTRRYGVPRPVDADVRQELHDLRISVASHEKSKSRTFQSCRRCHEAPVYVKKSGLCQACYAYRRRRQKSRPKYLFRQTCTNCEAPVGERVSSGLCARCFSYKRAYNKPRPERLWKTVDPWLGWCECGTRWKPVPATHVVNIQLGALNSLVDPTQKLKNDTLILCDNCYAEHERMRREGLHFDNRPRSAIRNEQ